MASETCVAASLLPSGRRVASPTIPTSPEDSSMRSTLVVLALALAGCNTPAPAPPPAPPPIDQAAVNQAVTDLWNRIIAADTANNVDAFLAEFANDVRLDIQGMPAVIGKTAFDSVARPTFASRDYTSLTYSPYSTVVVSNDL